MVDLNDDGTYAYQSNGSEGADSFTVRVTDETTGLVSEATIDVGVGVELGTFARAGDVFRINSVTGGDQREVHLVPLTEGNFVAVWTTNYGDSSSDIVMQRFRADGTPIGDETPVHPASSNTDQFIEATALAGGGYLVTWSELNGDGHNYGISGQRFDAHGNAIGGKFVANSQTSHDQMSSSTAGFDDGGFVIVWTDGYGGDGNLRAQVFNADGGKEGGEISVNTYTPDSQHASKVAVLADGGFLVSWVSSALDGSSSGVYGQRYGTDGAVVGPEFLINDETDPNHLDPNQSTPSLLATADGGFVVAWDRGGGAGDSEGWGIYGRVFEAPFGATDGHDSIEGTAAADVIDGKAGDDELLGGEGDDTLVGGAGVDVVEYAGTQADYTIDVDGETGLVTVEGSAGTDVLSGIESLVFSGDADPIDLTGTLPVATDSVIQVAKNSAALTWTFTADGEETDADGNPNLLYSAEDSGSNTVTTSNGVSVVINADGTFTYTPNPTDVGSDSFTYRVTDTTTGISSVATVNVGVFAPLPPLTDFANLDGILKSAEITLDSHTVDSVPHNSVKATAAGNDGYAMADVAFSTGKWFYMLDGVKEGWEYIGLVTDGNSMSNYSPGHNVGGWGARFRLSAWDSADGVMAMDQGTNIPSVAAVDIANDKLAMAVDAGGRKAWVGYFDAGADNGAGAFKWLDGSSGFSGNPETGANPTFTLTDTQGGDLPAGQAFRPAVGVPDGSWVTIDFGQKGFSGVTPPGGYC